jgi:deoxyadenosine/deoxycytidine kinase
MKNFVIQKQQTEAEELVYQEWFNFITRKVDYNIDALVYLRCSAETCFERCKNRNRKEESTIPIEYLK